MGSFGVPLNLAEPSLRIASDRTEHFAAMDVSASFRSLTLFAFNPLLELFFEFPTADRSIRGFLAVKFGGNSPNSYQ